MLLMVCLRQESYKIDKFVRPWYFLIVGYIDKIPFKNGVIPQNNISNGQNYGIELWYYVADDVNCFPLHIFQVLTNKVSIPIYFNICVTQLSLETTNKSCLIPVFDNKILGPNFTPINK